MISANTAQNSTTKDLLKAIMQANYDSHFTKKHINKRVKYALNQNKTGAQLDLNDYLAYNIPALVDHLTEQYQLTGNYQLLKIANDLASPKKNLTQKKFIDYSYGRTVSILRQYGYHVVFSFSDTITFYWRDNIFDKTKKLFNKASNLRIHKREDE